MSTLWSNPYTVVAAVVAVFFFAAIAARIVHALVHRVLDTLDIVGAENRAALQARARQLTGGLAVLAYGLAAIASISLALARFGISEARWDPRQLAHGLLVHGVDVVI